MDIKKFIQEYQDGTVQVTPEVSYNITDVINENNRLFHACFENKIDTAGLEKIFYPMIWIIYRTIVMASDVDLKDIQLRSTNGKKMLMISLLKMVLKSRLYRMAFGTTIDKMMSELVWNGSVIVKRCNSGAEIVRLDNVIRPPHIKNIQEGGLVEKTLYNYEQMSSMKDDIENWDEVEQVWEAIKTDGGSKFTVYEYWTEDEFNGKYQKGCIKYIDRSFMDPKTYKTAEQWDTYLEIQRFKSPYKLVRPDSNYKEGEEITLRYPYEEMTFFDVPGRWLGFGCAELLKGINKHYQEKTNLYRKKDILDLRGIFVHKYSAASNSLTQEFLSNLETGDVLSMSIDEDLQRLIIDTKTGEFIASIDKMYEIMRMVMGVTAQGTGEELPSSTTATQVVANKQTQQTTYDYVRERMHFLITNLMMNGFVEDILKDIKTKEVVEITGDPRELEEIDSQLSENLVNKASEEYLMQYGKRPSEENYNSTLEKTKSEVRKGDDMRWVNIRKEMLKDLNYYVEFYVTNENFDKMAKIQTLERIKQDPNSTLSKQAVEEAILDLLNENPIQYRKTEEEKAKEAELVRQQMMQEAMANQPPAPMEMPAPLPNEEQAYQPLTQ